MNNYKSGNFILDIFFPAAGRYTVRILGRKGTAYNDLYLFHYNVTARAGVASGEVPPQDSARFEMDGLRDLSHNKTDITARRELTISLKAPKNFRLWTIFKRGNRTINGAQTTREDSDGTRYFTFRFPKRGKYTLEFYGENTSVKYSACKYLAYTINCIEIYTRNSEPVALYRDFYNLGFTKAGLSHKSYNLSAGRFLRIILRGKPGVNLIPLLERKSPNKYYRARPGKVSRSPAVQIGNEYHVYAYFPAAGEYSLHIQAETSKPGAKDRKIPVIARYKITASGGYSDRELDRKLGFFYDEKQYIKPVGYYGSRRFGSAGKLVWATDMAEAERISRSQNRILMVLHCATWCGFCKKLKKETLTHPDVVNFARSRFVAIEVGCAKIGNLQIYNRKYKKFKIATPSTTFIAPDGKFIYTYSGYAPGEHFLKVMKNVVAMKDGLLGRYERYHKQGNTAYTFKLLESYRTLGKKQKAKKLMLDLIAQGKVSGDKLPEYYYRIAGYSYGSEKEKYYRKVIALSHNIGFYWYYSVYRLAVSLYGYGKGGSTADALNRNEKTSIAFLEKYIRNDAYSPAWRSYYNDLIHKIRNFSARKRKKKGWHAAGSGTSRDPGLAPSE